MEAANSQPGKKGIDDILTSREQRSFSRFLKRMVGQGFRLSFAQVYTPVERQRLVKWAHSVLAADSVSFFEVDLASLAGENIWAELQQHLAWQNPPEKAVIFLWGLENTKGMEKAEGRPPVLQQLNVQRDIFVRDFPVTWVLFLHPYTRHRLLRIAPDFCDFASPWLQGRERLPLPMVEPISETYTRPEMIDPEGFFLVSEDLKEAWRLLVSLRLDEARDCLAQYDLEPSPEKPWQRDFVWAVYQSRRGDLKNALAGLRSLPQRHELTRFDQDLILSQLRYLDPPISRGVPQERIKPVSVVKNELGPLPRDAVPEPGPLPPGSYLPFKPNPYFTGREGELLALAKQVQKGEIGMIGQIGTVTGMGGLGKTQLAIAFAYRYGAYFPGGVFWVSLAQAEAVPGELARCGQDGRLGLPQDFVDWPLDKQVIWVRAAWSEPVPRLVIFDNCENEDLLHRWRPTGGGCRLLVTSRRESWADPHIHTLPLLTLARSESIALLGRFLPTIELGDAEAIADELGDLPLALHMAGSCLEHHQMLKAGDYLTELRAASPLSHVSLQEQGIRFNPTGHDLDVGKTFAVSLTRLDPDGIDGLARDLLARAAFFAPGEPIPADLLVATLAEKPNNLDWKEGLKRLAQLGMITREGSEDPIIHRLVAGYAKFVLADADTLQNVEDAVISQAAKLINAGLPGPLLTWQTHLREITNRALEREDQRAAALSHNLGCHLQTIASYSDALPYYQQTLAIHQKHFGDQHPTTAKSLSNMGTLLQSMGKQEAARPYYEQALAVRKKKLGAQHPTTAISLNNMGALLHSMGELEAARPYYEQALAIRKKKLGDQHPDTAMSLNNMGALLHSMGELEAARSYFEQALSIFEYRFGKDHQNTKGVQSHLLPLDQED